MSKPAAASTQAPLTQDCDAYLTIGAITWQGKTGNECGHAEMHALHRFVQGVKLHPDLSQHNANACIQVAANLIGVYERDRLLHVSCPSRPVCLKCTAVLQSLGFQTRADSSWGTRTAGSTEWGVSNDVKTLLAYRGVQYDQITALVNPA